MSMRDIFLPIGMMYETADRLEQTGAQLQNDVETCMRVANSISWLLPRPAREQEQQLEGQFQGYFQQMLSARNAIARLVRGAADTTWRIDSDARRLLDPNL